ncbi:hypothetical protein EYF80_024925 [Liparis tanakae]|uniref:Uncharacterized protein n=1 Tax=Liparis tanakae TaxID=230148 RepID=A0A4Z2HIS3_9TELE|nr:hypothetical protein EYF80_024925 [Liparis tanakae]
MVCTAKLHTIEQTLQVPEGHREDGVQLVDRDRGRRMTSRTHIPESIRESQGDSSAVGAVNKKEPQKVYPGLLAFKQKSRMQSNSKALHRPAKKTQQYLGFKMQLAEDLLDCPEQLDDSSEDSEEEYAPPTRMRILQPEKSVRGRGARHTSEMMDIKHGPYVPGLWSAAGVCAIPGRETGERAFSLQGSEASCYRSS